MQIEDFCQMLREKLSGLENVKFLEDPGVVRMFSGGKWHNLFRCITLRMVAGDLAIDYVNLTISVIVGERRKIIFNYGDVEHCYALDGRPFSKLNNNLYLGAIDDLTKEKVNFHQKTFILGNKFYDQDLNLIATSGCIRLRPENIVSIQHIHILDELCVISSHYTVTIQGKDIAINDKLYSFYRIDGKKYMLIGDNNTIELTPLTSCRVMGNLRGPETTFRGLVIPNFMKFHQIYEMDGVWFGEPAYGVFNPLYPFAPESGQKTKPAFTALE